MAFDQSTRTRLQRFVSEARTLLTEECTRQLQHEYGMNPAAGEVVELPRLPPWTTRAGKRPACSVTPWPITWPQAHPEAGRKRCSVSSANRRLLC
jgi:hypothetical protein